MMASNPYLGFDFDDSNKSDAIAHLRNASKALEIFDSRPYEAFLRLSGSGNGYHGKIEGKQLMEINPNLLFLIRKSYGDDTLRVSIDQQREKNGISYDILFDSYERSDGIVHHAGKWERI